MALSTPSESPAVVVKEIDLTGGVPNVQSTTGATVIQSTWGPVDERTLVSNEADLVERFGAPNTTTTFSFHRANMFLKYSSKMQIVRIIDDSATNATALTRQTGTAFSNSLAFKEVVKNEANFNAQLAALDSDNHTFVAKYPGTLGNSLQVQICPASDSATGSPFNSWAYKADFDAAPKTSNAAAKKNNKNDEIHIAVIDKNGAFTGTKGSVLERFAFLSIARGAKDDAGSTIFAKDVVNDASQYVWLVGLDSDFQLRSGRRGFDQAFNDSGGDYELLAPAVKIFNFDSGRDASSLSQADVIAGYDLFDDKDQVEIDFLIAPGETTRLRQTAAVNHLVSIAQGKRKDCVVVAGPARQDIVNQTSTSTIVSNIVDTADTFTKSSYLVMDGNYLKVFDKFNDQFIEIPAASSTAGIMAATDLNRAPWFSPAGSRRGQYLGITSIAFSPTKAQRDTLYKAGVNPIANIPGAGVILFGDKTKLARPSAFDRINVRRLFLVLERAISRAAEQVLFEFNDEFTRAEFVNIVEPVLREVKGRRGITDFRVVADETNNTPEVIDRNEFIASIFIKPARSINFITLNFVAVRTGVDFEEVVGTV